MAANNTLVACHTHVSVPKASTHTPPTGDSKSSQSGGGAQSYFSHSNGLAGAGSARYSRLELRSVNWNGSVPREERAEMWTVVSRDGAPASPKLPGVGAAPLIQLRVPAVAMRCDGWVL